MLANSLQHLRKRAVSISSLAPNSKTSLHIVVGTARNSTSPGAAAAAAATRTSEDEEDDRAFHGLSLS